MKYFVLGLGISGKGAITLLEKIILSILLLMIN